MRTAARWAAALGFALVCGVAMSFGQTYASDAVRPLFNSAAPVVAVAGLVALAARHAWSSVLLGAMAGPTLVAGYYVTSHVRGFANSTSSIALWGAAGIAFGAAMGLATWLLRSRVGPMWRAAAASLWPGIAIGEAWHGLARIADSTPASYWWTQAALGVAVLAVLSGWRVPTWSGRVLAVIFTAAVAAATFALYGAL